MPPRDRRLPSLSAATRPPRAAVFLDRDGTINEDRGFVHRPEDLALFPGAIEALASLKRAGFLLIVVSNQSGVARGYYTEADVERFHAHMNAVLAAKGAGIDAFYYCPFLADAPIEAYRRDSPWRKPDVGMFEAACRDHGIDVLRSHMIGDRSSDVEFAAREVAVAENLVEAARLVLDRDREAG